ncbi:FIST signal transduction protein [Vibrio astriarenae]|uniref:FIST signal transduction protein n=1 Tax=Vibrio astriarenae TaxID=1481923 RepID=UPI003736AC5F
MKFVTSISHLADPNAAIQEVAAQLPKTKPSCLICYYTEDYESTRLQAEVTRLFPETPLIACSTCTGVASEKGLHFGQVVGVMAIYDSKSVFGTAIARVKKNENVSLVTKDAIETALIEIERIGELPSFILCHPTPGIEEEVVRAIDDYFHSPVPIVGGSASDHHVDERWSLFNESISTESGIVMMLVYSDTKCTHSFSAGYTETQFSGEVTKASGRDLQEIDGRPAQEVYRQWIASHANVDVPVHFEFDLVTQYSLGRKVGQVFNHSYFKLSHPIRVSDNKGAIRLFTNVERGDIVTLMDGNRQEMIERPARVLRDASLGKPQEFKPLGALLVICAGPMLFLKDDIYELQEHIVQAIGDTPFLSPFTFGEQGRFIGGEIAHANLMVTSAVFHH